MTFGTFETSVADGSPVELYEFVRGASTYLYTSQAVDFVYQTRTYSASSLSRSSAEQTNEVGRSNLRITAPRDLAAIAESIQVPPANIMTVTLRRIHRGDTDAVVVWVGRVLNIDWRGDEAEIRCEPVYTSLRRLGLRRHYQRNCPFALYDTDCRADPSLHRTTDQVSAINGFTVSVPAAAGIAAGQLDGGFASWTSFGGGAVQRMIVTHSGADVQLMAPPFGLIVGATILLHDGCDRTLAVCDSLFANTINYGGFPFIPLRNPFDGNPLF